MPSIARVALPSLLSLSALIACGDSSGKPKHDADLDAGSDAGDARDQDAALADEDAGADAGEPAGDEDAGADAGLDAGEGDELQQVTLTFRAQFGAEPFACGSEVAEVAASQETVSPADLRLFLQDIVLFRADDGTEVKLVLDAREPFQAYDTVLLDFEDGTGECAATGNAATNHEVTGRLPRGEYRGLAFSQGVPEAVNHLDPVGMKAPLNGGLLHWGWQGGYLFLRAELKHETGKSSAHLGSTACTGSPSEGYACSKSNRARVVLPDFDLASQEVVFDVAELFKEADLTKPCHGMGPACDPFFAALGISTEDGRADESLQRVYRAE